MMEDPNVGEETLNRLKAIPVLLGVGKEQL